MDLRLPAIAKRFKIPVFELMSLLIFLLLPLSLATAWGQVSVPLPEESTQAAIEAVLADFDAKKNDEALAKLETLQKKLPDDPLILNLIGSVYSKKRITSRQKPIFAKP